MSEQKPKRVRFKPGKSSSHLGRRIRKMTAAEAFAVSPFRKGRNTIVCGRCPKWIRGFCTIQAKVVASSSSACNYGKTLFKAKRQAEKWRKPRQNVRNDAQ